MESNHPRSVTPRNSVLKTGKATGPYPSPHSEIKRLARWIDGVQLYKTRVSEEMDVARQHEYEDVDLDEVEKNARLDFPRVIALNQTP